METVRIMMALANKQKTKIRQLDIATAFLHSEINYPSYVEIPQGADGD